LSSNSINIAILESSQIIYEGLSNIFLKSSTHIGLFRVDNISEIENFFPEEKLDIVIINPSQIQNRVKEFITIKKRNPDTFWIALVYNLFDRELLSLFNKTISINDSVKAIINIIDNFDDFNSSDNLASEQEQLTEREIEVLKLLVAGLSNKEIADELFISVHTVVSHRKNLTQKTGIKSQAGLTIYAISNKIIQIEDYTN
jgi:DNA-binding NarL/FixJ family response regulator